MGVERTRTSVFMSMRKHAETDAAAASRPGTGRGGVVTVSVPLWPSDSSGTSSTCGSQRPACSRTRGRLRVKDLSPPSTRDGPRQNVYGKESDFYRSSVLNGAGHGGSSDHAPNGANDGERPSASSRRRPAASRVASVPRRVCTCRPMGRPSSDCPAGRVRMGWPVTAVGQL